MNPSSSLPSSSSSREAELARAEAELAREEARLAEQFLRTSAESEALSRRLAELREQVARVPAERWGDEEVRTAGARLESASVHTGSTEDARERALTARHEALEARQQAGEEVQRALKALQHLNARARQELAEAEAGLKRSEEAAARAQREREAAVRAQRAREVTQARHEREATRARHVPVASHARAAPETARVERASRVRMEAAIDSRSDSNFFTGFSPDISEGGVFVATVRTVPRGTPVELDLRLPGGRPMKVSGVVDWTREANNKTPELMPGLGVRFTELPPEVAAAISAFVGAREPLFFPA